VWKAAATFAVLLLIATRTAADDSAIVTPLRIGRADAPHKLTLWAQQDYSHLAANPEVSAVFTDIFEQWARAHPDVQIEVSVMPALELHKAKLLLASAAGRLPDIASVDSFWMPLFLERGDVQPLDPYWPAEDRADFLPFTISTLSDRQGHVYGLWHGTDCRVLYYRTDLVPTPPRSWDDLLTVASRISREKHIAGYLYNAGRWEATVFDHLPMFWAQGGELVNGEGRPIFGEPPHRERMVRLLSFLRDTVRSGASPRAVLGMNDYKQLSAAAIAGDTAMFLGGNWQIRELKDALSPEEFARWGIAPIPQYRAAPPVTGTGGWIWVVFAKDPERRRAAAQFVLDVEAPHNSARISQGSGRLPVRRSVYRDFPVFRENRWYARFGEMLTTARARPAVPIYPAISEQLQLAVGTAVAGTKTPEAAADDAWTAVRRIAERNRARAAQPPPTVDLIAAVPPIGSVLVLLVLLGVIGRRSWPLAVWLAPALALVSAFLLYPVLDLVRLAFTDARTAGPGYTYGLQTLLALTADSEFRAMVIVTVVFVAACVILQLGVGLAIALLIDAAVRRRAAVSAQSNSWAKRTSRNCSGFSVSTTSERLMNSITLASRLSRLKSPTR